MDPNDWTVLRNFKDSFKKDLKYVYIFGEKGEEVLMITRDDKVFAFGENKNGCLGLIKSVVPNKEPVEVQQLSGHGIKSFSASRFSFMFNEGRFTHVAALTAIGNICIFGSNKGQSPITYLTNPPNVTFVQVVCGKDFILALTDKGSVYSWVLKTSILYETKAEQSWSFMRCITGDSIFNISVIKMVAIASNISYAVTTTGQIYFWEENNDEISRSTTVQTPEMITGFEKSEVVTVCSSPLQVIVLCKDGCVYSLPTWISMSAAAEKLKKISGMGIVVDIATHPYRDMFVAKTEDSKIFMWDQNRIRSDHSPLLTDYGSINEVFAYEAVPALTPELIEVEADIIISDLKKAFDCERVSDLRVIVEDKPIHVSKFMLKIRSLHFLACLSPNWMNDSCREITMDGYSYNVYRALLYYLYTNEIVVLNEDYAMEMLILADMYLLNDLKVYCLHFLMRSVNVDNLISLFTFATANHLIELENSCVQYASRVLKELVLLKSFQCVEAAVSRDLLVKAILCKSKIDSL